MREAAVAVAMVRASAGVTPVCAPGAAAGDACDGVEPSDAARHTTSVTITATILVPVSMALPVLVEKRSEAEQAADRRTIHLDRYGVKPKAC